MRIAGHCQSRPISIAAPATPLFEGARFNDGIHRQPVGNDSLVPKCVYRFKTHAKANQHQEECLAWGMAALNAYKKKT